METLIENIPIGITFTFYEFIDEHVRGGPNGGSRIGHLDLSRIRLKVLGSQMLLFFEKLPLKKELLDPLLRISCQSFSSKVDVSCSAHS